MPKPCYSSCRKVSAAQCKAPRCTLSRAGRRPAYCGLNKKLYKLDHVACVTKKKQTGPVAAAAAQNLTKRAIQRIKTHLQQRKVVNFTKKVRARKLLEGAKQVINSWVLRTLCRSSGACLALGKENDRLKAFFGNFTSFKYLQRPITAIGAESVNGFIRELVFARDTPGGGGGGQYQAYAVLKSTKNAQSDNLMYEYFAGQYCNKLNKEYPGFLETYGLFKYATKAAWAIMKDMPSEAQMRHILLDSKKLIPLPVTGYADFKVGCPEAQYLAVLVQHVEDPVSLHDFFYGGTNTLRHVLAEILPILFQVYQPLAWLSKTFHHNDLHTNNVLLYTPAPGQYIEYHYQDPAGGPPVTFKSQYIVKLLDYGRAYFYGTAQFNTAKVREAVCQLPECASAPSKLACDAGLKRHGLLKPLVDLPKSVSRDLWLISLIRPYFSNPAIAPLGPMRDFFTELKQAIFSKVPTTDAIMRNFWNAGSDSLTPPATITTVGEAAEAIKAALAAFAYNDDALPFPRGKYGDLYVEPGQAMRFIKRRP